MAGIQTMGSTLTLKKAGSEGQDLVIANLTSIGEIKGEREEIDVTTLDSPDRAKEFISGAVDFGSFDIAGNIVDGKQPKALFDLFDGGTLRDWEIGTPNGAKLAVKAYGSGFAFGEKTTDGLDTFTMTLRISGKPVYTPAN